MKELLNEILPLVERPARYIGNEINMIKKDWEKCELTFCLAFPDIYEVGMSHVGYMILYEILNKDKRIAAERVFAPWPDMEAMLKKNGLPLFSLESKKPLYQFDIIGFSIQYELTYTNILRMIELGGIPVEREKRDSSMPLIIGGGPCVSNPEPLADFFDFFLIGDGEETLPIITEKIINWKHAKQGKETLFKELSKIEGIYIPSFFSINYNRNGKIKSIVPLQKGYEKVKKATVSNLNKANYFNTPLIPNLRPIHNRLSMEIARGCPHNCRFCHATFIYRPFREREASDIVKKVNNLLKRSGYEEIALLSLSSGDYSQIQPLLETLMDSLSDKKIAISFPSLRVGSLSERMVKEIKRVRMTGFTLAPEAATQRLRDVINKPISEEELLLTARSIFGMGWKTIKLYFMIGLPTETIEDIKAIPELIRKVIKQAPKGNRRIRVNASISTFIPKPHTPFQWVEQIPPEKSKEILDLLKRKIPRGSTKLKWQDPNMSLLEGIFARGDRRLGKVLIHAVKKGASFDGWGEHFKFKIWEESFKEEGINLDLYLNSRKKNEILPWNMIDTGVNRSFLWREYSKALIGETSPDCDLNLKGCPGCGVCNKKDLVPIKSGPLFGEKKERISVFKENRQRYLIRFQKIGDLRFLSHLDMVTLIHRAFRRAEIPIKFSEGFHPMPSISIPQALPVGFESLWEIMGVETIVKISPKEMKEKINRELPVGIQILNIYPFPLKFSQYFDNLKEIKYLVVIFTSDNKKNELKENIKRFYKEKELNVSDALIKEKKTLEAKRSVIELFLIDQLEIDNDKNIEFWIESLVKKDITILRIGLQNQNGHFLRIQDFLSLFLKMDKNDIKKARILKISQHGTIDLWGKNVSTK
ncbi:MAG: TIGR03960 family B12-binding radical SAM protein [Deltaproteobacteria bacterium]|nr:MAG: TIGR03960 family B12-binding radical SAM protein [Deltaproteobacteria bacterium]